MTSPQTTGNQPDWKNLSGTTLDGGYELKEIVEAEQGAATLRVRVLGDYTLRALARFYVVDKATAQEQVNIWQAVHRLESKDHLSVPLGAGRLLLNGLTFAYLVFQVPDETLAEVIKGRPLEQQETLEAMRSVAQGLSELHAAGFVHGSLAPEEILALGDSIRCSTETVRRTDRFALLNRKAARYLAPESDAQNVTPSADIWCLGATLFEALTQKPYEPTLLEQAENLKHPFGVLTAACLEPNPEKRCRLTDLDRLSRSVPPAPKPKPVTVAIQEAQPDTGEGRAGRAATAAAGQGSASASNGSGTSMPAEADKVVSMPETRRFSRDAGSIAASTAGLTNSSGTRPEFTSRRSATSSAGQASAPGTSRAEARQGAEYRGPARLAERENITRAEEKTSLRSGSIYALVGFVVIFLLLWFFGSRTSHTRHSASVAPVATPSSPAAHTAWPTKTLAPEKGSTVAPPPGVTPAAVASTGERTIWRVILYTYHRQQDAATKAHDLGAKHPDLRPDVLAPDGDSGPYLVVAGGQMDRQSAAKLKQRAVREGMPRDSYIQNFSR